MVRDKGCASVAATSNDADSETAMCCPKPGSLSLPRLKCISLFVGCTKNEDRDNQEEFHLDIPHQPSLQKKP